MASSAFAAGEAFFVEEAFEAGEAFAGEEAFVAGEAFAEEEAIAAGDEAFVAGESLAGEAGFAVGEASVAGEAFVAGVFLVGVLGSAGEPFLRCRFAGGDGSLAASASDSRPKRCTGFLARVERRAGLGVSLAPAAMAMIFASIDGLLVLQRYLLMADLPMDA